METSEPSSKCIHETDIINQSSNETKKQIDSPSCKARTNQSCDNNKNNCENKYPEVVVSIGQSVEMSEIFDSKLTEIRTLEPTSQYVHETENTSNNTVSHQSYKAKNETNSPSCQALNQQTSDNSKYCPDSSETKRENSKLITESKHIKNNKISKLPLVHTKTDKPNNSKSSNESPITTKSISGHIKQTSHDKVKDENISCDKSNINSKNSSQSNLIKTKTQSKELKNETVIKQTKKINTELSKPKISQTASPKVIIMKEIEHSIPSTCKLKVNEKKISTPSSSSSSKEKDVNIKKCSPPVATSGCSRPIKIVGTSSEIIKIKTNGLGDDVRLGKQSIPVPVSSSASHRKMSVYKPPVPSISE